MRSLVVFLAALTPLLPDPPGQSRAGQWLGLELADQLLIPMLPLAVLVASKLRPSLLERHLRSLALFVAVAILASITVTFRIPSADPRAAFLGVARMLQFSAHVAIAFCVLRFFAAAELRRFVLYGWLTGFALLVGVMVLQTQFGAGSNAGQPHSFLLRGNIVSVSLALLVVGMLVARGRVTGNAGIRLLLGLLALTGVIGMLFSTGRGGWVALAVAGLWYIPRFRLRQAWIVAAVVAIGVVSASYSETVSKTMRSLFVDEQTYSVLDDDAMSLDDGYRVEIWRNEAPKFIPHPMLGWGVFHRGGASPLWATSSHNFFLQLFLETGLCGGLTFVWFLFGIWRAASGLQPYLRTGARAVLTAMVVGGMSGEYFFSILPMYAFIISLWMMAAPDAFAQPPAVDGSRETQPRRSPMVNRARRVMPSAARASRPPSSRSTMQSAPMT